MQYKHFPLVMSVVLLASCGSADKEAGPASSSDSLPPVTTTTTTVNSTGDTIPVNSPVTTAPVSSSGLNPEHGKPGHRCDLAVGAPLNSAPAPASTSPVITTAPVQSPVVTAPVASSGAGMNPAHGQPGHRCDIAVGAPLDSKPTGAATTTTPLSLQPSIPEAKPVITPAAPATKTATAPGMNPAHGEPGHRCDIAVGAPLNSKPLSVTKEPEKAKDN